ncbi:bifunctional 2-polyprenyl-6-hydroxyphenol methylase/3-demethylubiquinol 3-O-methyltransferase UbiG [Piscinibacter sp. HJYY11]|uniref:class I SAM-dependent methyltransferase n=1 Tax=Piscinibacter sp. HJYY11 TaxID=2801333 RepID=UPI00191CB3CE|nr:class I SAM-dependent methyltransferase [Piscinibacter sp. HJYY11]MBL0727927.1 methyltransferase domain-containing protein [Piscinibacter sp. HJYY11]
MTDPTRFARTYRWLDGLQGLWHPGRRAFRRELLRILDRAAREWPSADYGSGYLYQSFPRLGLRGFRQTDTRVAQMDLGASLAGRSVIEIGCNTGFLSLSLSPGTRRYLAFDNNPFLMDIARLAQKELGDGTVEFRTNSLEDLQTEERFDVALSFANHSTWDGNMSLSLDAYFARLQGLLAPGGTLFFESHHPTLEDAAALAGTTSVMERRFRIDGSRVLSRGSPWDTGRTFIRATALP